MKKRILDVIRSGNSYCITKADNRDILISLKTCVGYEFLRSLSKFKRYTKKKKVKKPKYSWKPIK